jgi:hypothetical protein
MFVTLWRTIRFTPVAAVAVLGAVTTPPKRATIAARPRTGALPRSSSSPSSQKV